MPGTLALFALSYLYILVDIVSSERLQGNGVNRKVDIALQNVEAILDNQEMINNVISSGNDVVVLQGMTSGFRSDLKLNPKIASKYSFTDVGSTGFLYDKNRIDCGHSVAYQTLNTFTNIKAKESPVQAKQALSTLEAMLVIECKSLHSATDMEEVLNIVAFTIENVKKLSSEYCNLLQDVTNDKYNLVIMGNIRQNKQLETCLKRRLQMWDAWKVFKDGGGFTFDVSRNALANYVKRINSKRHYNKRRDRIYLKNMKYQVDNVALNRGNENRKRYKGIKYYMSADYGLRLSLSPMGKPSTHAQRLCSVYKDSQYAKKDLEALTLLLQRKEQYLDEGVSIKGKGPIAKNAFDVFQKFALITAKLIQYIEEYMTFDSSRITASNKLHRHKSNTRVPFHLQDPQSLKLVFGQRSKYKNHKMIKKQKHLMKLNALRDPSDVNALFGDDDDDDVAQKSPTLSFSIHEEKPELKRASASSKQWSLALKKIREIRKNILKKNRKRMLEQNRYNPLKTNNLLRRGYNKALAALLRI